MIDNVNAFRNALTKAEQVWIDKECPGDNVVSLSDIPIYVKMGDKSYPVKMLAVLTKKIQIRIANKEPETPPLSLGSSVVIVVDQEAGSD